MIRDFLHKKIGISVAICLIIIKPSHNYLLGVTIGCEKFKTWTGSIKLLRCKRIKDFPPDMANLLVLYTSPAFQSDF